MEISLQGISVLSIRFSLSWQNLILVIYHDICFLKNLSTKLYFFSFQCYSLPEHYFMDFGSCVSDTPGD